MDERYSMVGFVGEYFPEDTDGGEFAPNGRVMEMLSEHTVEGWLEGYVLSGRHGLLNSYEPFIHVISDFHSYPWLVHRLTYRRACQRNIHVRGYKEKGNINTPLELAIQNQTDRFSLAIDAIDRMPRFQVKRAARARRYLTIR